MATTWSRITSRFGIIGLFTCTTAAGLWFGCAGANPGYNPSGGSKLNTVSKDCVKTPDVDVPDPVVAPFSLATPLGAAAAMTADAAFKDSNCDGIDGDANTSVFVSPDGDDLNPGSPESPRKTINGAIARAVELNTQAGNIVFNAIILGKGDFNETVALAPGIGLYGGYDHLKGWTRSVANSSRINGPGTGITATNISRETQIQMVSIMGAQSTVAGSSSYGLLASNSSGPIILNGCYIEAADGANGAVGADGKAGDPGGDGQRGTDGCDACNNTGTGVGGAGGTSTCGATGGNGGNGGYDASGAGGGNGAGAMFTAPPTGVGGGGGGNGTCVIGPNDRSGGNGYPASDGALGKTGLPADNTGIPGPNGYQAANGKPGTN
ncbi:MAG TPA: hypothetical protein PKI03_29845, partial [Pseudomonadota bacterium]|nr:hypothetical protein [Pseudomonadota bacterium]